MDANQRSMFSAARAALPVPVSSLRLSAAALHAACTSDNGAAGEGGEKGRKRAKN
jgi:hypothetical protein